MEIVKSVINLLVGLVVFVTGMNMMSTGLKESAGGSIRRLFRKIKNNRFISVFIGAGTTALIQSSGATTVMVVGFLTAGALTFSQGFSVMLGAFIGTTITGVLVNSGKSADISNVSEAPRCTPPIPPVAKNLIPAKLAQIIVAATVVAAVNPNLLFLLVCCTILN